MFNDHFTSGDPVSELNASLLSIIDTYIIWNFISIFDNSNNTQIIIQELPIVLKFEPCMNKTVSN